MKNVLIVDDEPGIASLVSLCLDHFDVGVLLADGVSGALNVARKNDIGLVLLDLALGDEDGLEILPRLRQEPSLEGIPIVAFSAHDSRRREALDRGADLFLGRPFAPADLRSTVEVHLAR
jgi:DNA-binding response OmpR family regulator